MSEATTPITVGTAGHIDHGKTLLVEKLTGMRADRPYERERGMTIDIGYAELRTPAGRRIGFVDLPGHERFIRNMVAGATGIDLVLLVVAADDGVMPQTREHMEILDLLGVRRGVVVLNKVDLVDEETREIALEELREFIAETGLKDAPLLACSATTGEGVEAVRDALLAAVAGVETTERAGSFFVGVQRTFAATGFGCIVTGVPAAGRVAVGDELELLPARKKARVRAIEVYHEPATEAHAGHRTALNLAGVHHDEVARGMVVAASGVFRPTRHVAVRLKVLQSAKRPLKHAGGLRFLSGTLEEMASLYLLSGDALAPGDEALVEIRTRAPITVRDGAPFIVRTDNARETLGGGVVVAALEAPIGRKNPEQGRRLADWADALADPRARLRTALLQDGPASPAALAARCQLEPGPTAAALRAMSDEGELVELPGSTFVPATAVRSATAAVKQALEALHRQHPLLASLPLAEVRDTAGVSEALLRAALAELGDAVIIDARTLRLASHSVNLDPELQSAAERVVGCLDDNGFAPPWKDKLAAAAGLSAKQTQGALTFLRDVGRVREVAPGLLHTKSTLDRGLLLLQRVAAKRGSFEPVDAKAVLGGISRKWLIPLLEYYDRLGATRRDGNQRILTRKGEAMAAQGIDAE